MPFRHGARSSLPATESMTELERASTAATSHDLSAAREMVLPALYPRAARGLPVLADKGYIGAGVGVLTPVKRHPGGPPAHR